MGADDDDDYDNSATPVHLAIGVSPMSKYTNAQTCVSRAPCSFAHSGF